MNSEIIFASYWSHVWKLDLSETPITEAESQITVHGVEREDEDGHVISTPLNIGTAQKSRFIRDVALLLSNLDEYHKVGGPTFGTR